MIFYFSGTGNSLYAAKKIAKKQEIKLYNIAEMINKKHFLFVPEDGEIIGFVFPVYAWAPPKIVLDFIKKIQIARKNNYIFAIGTCGGDAGNVMDVLRNTLMANQLPLNSDFSVTMPNNYILINNLSKNEKISYILKCADEQLLHINEMISKRQNISESEKGKFSIIKTKIISPLFNNFSNPAEHFIATNKCNSCGFCVKICPTNNITIIKGEKPIWGKKCINCFGCINRCPREAIEHGTKTINKKRYYNSNCDKTDD